MMNSTFNFEGKVAFVTGGGSGIGRAAALAFARTGASVAVVDIGEQANKETARLIEQAGGRALAVRCDVTKADEVKAALENMGETFGRLDFAFNNAGLEPKKPAPTADYDEEEWNRIIDIDLRGVFLCMKHEIPLILKSGGGAIVNTSSGAGVIGIKGSPAYTAAKHGVVGLTRAAAPDYAAQNIRINAVCPGYVDTPMMGRFTGGRPCESHLGGADRKNGYAGGNREHGSLALFGGSRLRCRPRARGGRRPDDRVMFTNYSHSDRKW
jgi:NAD(P)-dependent dehydrogenase (short-subunit alcohol dehydrogenase family)